MNFSINDLALCGGSHLIEAKDSELKSAFPVMLKMLEGSNDGAFVLTMYLSRILKLTVSWSPAGLGAGVVAWTEGESLVAASIVCGGLDYNADQAAITALVEQFQASQGIIDEINAMKTPFLSTLYATPESITDLKVCPLSVGFGQAFFSRLHRHLPPQFDPTVQPGG